MFISVFAPIKTLRISSLILVPITKTIVCSIISTRLIKRSCQITIIKLRNIKSLAVCVDMLSTFFRIFAVAYRFKCRYSNTFYAMK